MINFIIDYIFNNNFYKLCIAFIIVLMITFSHELIILKQYWVLICVSFVTFLLLSNNIENDLGIILLMVALLIIIYNEQSQKNIQKNIYL